MTGRRTFAFTDLRDFSRRLSGMSGDAFVSKKVLQHGPRLLAELGKLLGF